MTLLNNYLFYDYEHRIYIIAPEIKYTTKPEMSTKHFHLNVLYGYRDDYDFLILIFLSVCLNIPTGPAYAKYVMILL